MVAGHCIPLAPLFKAVFDLLVPSCAEIFIHEVCKGSVAHPPFLLCVSAFDIWQQASLRSVCVSF